MWSAPITAGGATRPTISVKTTASADIGATVLEYSGLSPAAGTGVTVTASATDPANPTPLLLITSPLVADLLPGATVSLDVPRIEALTGMTTNWLSVDLIVLGDATWLGPYSPAGAWFSDARPGNQGQRGRSSQPD